MISQSIIAKAAQYRRAFQSARPFKHVCIDKFFTGRAAAAALADFPPFNREFARNEFGEYGGKAVINNIAEISPFYTKLYGYFMSREFLAAMSAITGIDDLHADPTLYGGGTHENINGQELDVHVDFNFQIEGGFHRRANLLLYLNKEWDAAWGGAIELHSDPRHPDRDEFKQFNAIFNRAVIFETNEHSWHGFREIRLPADRPLLSRKCLSIYLYTPDRPAHEIAGPHSTFYIQWPFPKKFAAGRTLSADDADELHRGYARRDQQIAMYQRMAERLGRDLQPATPGRAKGMAPDLASESRGVTIEFGSAGNGRQYCRQGWADPEEFHTWAVGTASTIELPRPSIPGTYVLAFEIRPFCWPNMPAQRLSVRVNGSEVARIRTREVGTPECVVPWSVLGARPVLSLVFEHPDAAKPSEVGDSGDVRELAFAFARLHLFRLLATDEPCPHGFVRLPPAGGQLSELRPSPAIYLYAGLYAGDEIAAPEDGFFVQWPFSEKFAAGRLLSQGDVDELRRGYVRRDRQIELYQHMETRLGAALEQARTKH